MIDETDAVPLSVHGGVEAQGVPSLVRIVHVELWVSTSYRTRHWSIIGIRGHLELTRAGLNRNSGRRCAASRGARPGR